MMASILCRSFDFGRNDFSAIMHFTLESTSKYCFIFSKQFEMNVRRFDGENKFLVF